MDKQNKNVKIWKEGKKGYLTHKTQKKVKIWLYSTQKIVNENIKIIERLIHCKSLNFRRWDPFLRFPFLPTTKV